MNILGKALAGAGEAVEKAAHVEHQAGLLRDLEQHKSGLELQRQQTLSELRKGETKYAADLALEYKPKMDALDVQKQTDLYQQVESPKLVQTADLQRGNLLAVEQQRSADTMARLKETIKAQSEIHREDRASAERRTEMQVNATLSSLKGMGIEARPDAEGYWSILNIRDGTIRRMTDESGKPVKAGAKDGDQAFRLIGGIAQLAKTSIDANDPEGAKYWNGVAQTVMGSVLNGRGIEMPSAAGAVAPGGDVPLFQFDDVNGRVLLRGQQIGTARTLTEARAVAARANTGTRGGATSSAVTGAPRYADLYSQIESLSGPQGLGNPDLDETGRGLIGRQLQRLADQVPGSVR